MSEQSFAMRFRKGGNNCPSCFLTRKIIVKMHETKPQKKSFRSYQCPLCDMTLDKPIRKRKPIYK